MTLSQRGHDFKNQVGGWRRFFIQNISTDMYKWHVEIVIIMKKEKEGSQLLLKKLDTLSSIRDVLYNFETDKKVAKEGSVNSLERD